jgi:hypothetical protein
VVLRKALVDTRATGCKVQQLRNMIDFIKKLHKDNFSLIYVVE